MVTKQDILDLFDAGLKNCEEVLLSTVDISAMEEDEEGKIEQDFNNKIQHLVNKTILDFLRPFVETAVDDKEAFAILVEKLVVISKNSTYVGDIFEAYSANTVNFFVDKLPEMIRK